MPKPAITAMHKFGTYWLVTLQCGHKFTVTAQELKEQQLYIGRHIPCDVCADEYDPKDEENATC